MTTDVNLKLREELIARGLHHMVKDIKPDRVNQTEVKLLEFISCSSEIEMLKRRVIKLAPHSISVLITGETGVGKELVAEALHGERKGKFVPVNCGGIPDSLLEAEFFGAVKGAYTGCNNDRTGYLHEANEGTLFLDEIGELPSLMQCKLLRVLQNKRFRRVGSVSEEHSNFRLVSATNRLKLEEHKDFRTDLYYRMAATKLHITPLRNRVDDAHLIIRKFSKSTEVANEIISFVDYEFKGNVRQLLNIIEEANIFYAKT